MDAPEHTAGYQRRAPVAELTASLASLSLTDEEYLIRMLALPKEAGPVAYADSFDDTPPLILPMRSFEDNPVEYTSHEWNLATGCSNVVYRYECHVDKPTRWYFQECWAHRDCPEKCAHELTKRFIVDIDNGRARRPMADPTRARPLPEIRTINWMEKAPERHATNGGFSVGQWVSVGGVSKRVNEAPISLRNTNLYQSSYTYIDVTP